MLTLDPATRDFIELDDPSRPGLGRLPGLDGLRGLAVLGVLIFHAGFTFMVGGYLGVSTFFTLSGFLIASLLLHEGSRSDTISLRAFWGRRFRRLLPAALVTLAAVMLLFGPFVASADQRSKMGGDVLSSVFYVANWRFYFEGSSYAQLFSAPSPVLHFWSLAIEEQFYLVFPLMMLGLWRLCRGRRALLGGFLAVLVAGLVVEPFVFGFSVDRIYFGTDTRAPELLLGAGLAVLLSVQGVRRRLALRLYRRTVVASLGLAAFAVQLWWWWTLPQNASWLYRGGFAFYALLSCLVITAAALPSGPLRWALSWRPLRWVGARSYGIYLAHWPIYLTLRQLIPDWSRWLVTVVGIGASVALAECSYRFLERPVRLRRWPAPGRAVPVTGIAMIVVAALAFLPLPINKAQLTSDFDAQRAQLKKITSESSRPVVPTITATTAVATPPLPRISLIGDSTTLGVGIGLSLWSDHSKAITMTDGETIFGCPIARFDALRLETVNELQPSCTGWATRWPALLASTRPTMVILSSAVWHLSDVRLPGHSDFSSIGHQDVDDFIRSELVTAIDTIAATGALVVLLTWPRYGTWARIGVGEGTRRQQDPDRMDRFNQILAEAAALRPHTSRLIDLAGWMGDKSQDRTLRADGTHFKPPEFEQISDQWFGNEVVATWQGWWTTERGPGAAAPSG